MARRSDGPRSASKPERRRLVDILALFGPTAVGKTAVAIAVAQALRKRNEDPVAISCDSIQIYRGLEVLSGAATPRERQALEHRLVGIVDLDEEFSAGRFARLARREIDSLLASGRRPIVVGGTGLYLRAALSELALRPPVEPEIRAAVEREMAQESPEALHAQLDPEARASVHPRDRKRIVRALELQRAGLRAAADDAHGGELWSARMRHPTLLVGLIVERDALRRRIAERTRQMIAAGAREEAVAAAKAGASRTARAAIGFRELLADDEDALAKAHGAYARRQLTWMRRMNDVWLIDRSQRSDAEVAAQIVAELAK